MIEIKNLKKKFDHRWVADGIDLIIPDGQMTVIIGKSGEGKSVLLKQIIGLIKPTSGHIIVDGTDITQLNEKEFNSVYSQFGYVFQFAALLDSLTIFENIGITLLEKGIAHDHVMAVVREKMSLVNLSEDILSTLR